MNAELTHLVVPGLLHEATLDVIVEELLVGQVDAVGAPQSVLLHLYHLEKLHLNI